MASSSQLGCYLKDCIIPCCIFWPAQGAFISAAGREREEEIAPWRAHAAFHNISAPKSLCASCKMFSLSCQNRHLSGQRSLECMTCALVRHDQRSWSRGEGAQQGSLDPMEHTLELGMYEVQQVPQPLKLR